MDRWRGLTRRISRRTLLARGAGLAAGITFGGVLSGAQARPNPARVFNHVNVIAMDRPGVLWDQAVLVADGLVRAVAPAMARIPEGIVSIPADGRFLMPGLADMHLHLASPADLLVLLANGVTTVRDMSGTRDKLAWERAVAAGSMPGPTIHVASPIVDGVPPVFDDLLTASTPATGRSLVDRFAADGYEFVKVYSELRYAVLVAMVERARLHGLRVVGHCSEKIGLVRALLAGQVGLEHLYGYAPLLVDQPAPWSGWDYAFGGVPIREERMPGLVATTLAAGAWNCPTLVALDRWVPQPQGAALMQRGVMRYVAPANRRWWDPATNFLVPAMAGQTDAALAQGRQVRRFVAGALHDGGAPLLLGTDAGSPYVEPGFSVHTELANLVEAGLHPYEALRTATVAAASFLGAAPPFGRIAPGQRADLVLLDANPLDDVANARPPLGVMVRGQWLDRGLLDGMLLAVERAYA